MRRMVTLRLRMLLILFVDISFVEKENFSGE